MKGRTHRRTHTHGATMTIQIEFGALAPPLYKQLGLPRRRLTYLQDCADGLVALSVGHLLSDSETHRARRRLMKRILSTFGKELQRQQDSAAP